MTKPRAKREHYREFFSTLLELEGG